MRHLLFLIPLVIAACGGGAGNAPQGDGAATGGDATGAPAGAGADAGPAFGDVIKSGKVATYKVSYKLTGTGAGQDPNQSVEQTWYFKPPNTRLDFAGGDGYGGTARISMYFLKDGTFMCTVDGSEKTCLQMSSDAAAQQNLGFEIQDSFRDDPSAFNATFREKRSIAGQEAFCYVVAGAATLGISEGTFCYTKAGIPLLSRWSAGGSTVTMEATAFSTNVPDSDFQLPVPPTKFP